MHHPALDLPGLQALVAELPEGIAGRFRQAAATAHPAAVPALAIEEGEHRRRHEGEHETDADGPEPQRGGAEGTDRSRPQGVVVQRPEVAEVELRPLHQGQEGGQQEREAELEAHHAHGAPGLVAAVAVLHQELRPHHQHRERVEGAIGEPLIGGPPAQQPAQRVEQPGDAGNAFREPVQGHVVGRESDAQGPGDGTACRERTMEHAVVPDPSRLSHITPPDHQEDSKRQRSPTHAKHQRRMIGAETEQCGHQGHGPCPCAPGGQARGPHTQVVRPRQGQAMVASAHDRAVVNVTTNSRTKRRWNSGSKCARSSPATTTSMEAPSRSHASKTS